jgi:hypothetical protein
MMNLQNTLSSSSIKKPTEYRTAGQYSAIGRFFNLQIWGPVPSVTATGNNYAPFMSIPGTGMLHLER